MLISKITIKNFRLFSPDNDFVIEDINTPDGTNNGSGLNVFVGENGSGKTAILDALALPILEYKDECRARPVPTSGSRPAFSQDVLYRSHNDESHPS